MGPSHQSVHSCSLQDPSQPLHKEGMGPARGHWGKYPSQETCSASGGEPALLSSQPRAGPLLLPQCGQVQSMAWPGLLTRENHGTAEYTSHPLPGITCFSKSHCRTVLTMRKRTEKQGVSRAHPGHRPTHSRNRA